MSSANNMVFGNDVTVVDATQVYPLGTERLVLASQSGTGSDQVWRYVLNNTGSAFTQGQVVMATVATQSAGSGVLATQDVPKLRVLGVAQTYTTAGSALTTFGAGAYGWVLAHGYGSVLTAAAGVAADSTIAVSATAGSVYASPAPGSAAAAQANALAVIGYNHVATAAAAVVTTAWIDCR
jgi:hypothetical protein